MVWPTLGSRTAKEQEQNIAASPLPGEKDDMGMEKKKRELKEKEWDKTERQRIERGEKRGGRRSKKGKAEGVKGKRRGKEKEGKWGVRKRNLVD